MSNFIQVMILICSSMVAFLVGSKRGSVRRVAFVFGLVGQPFWMATAWMNHQWAIFGLSFWFAFCYARGIFNLRERKDHGS